MARDSDVQGTAGMSRLSGDAGRRARRGTENPSGLRLGPRRFRNALRAALPFRSAGEEVRSYLAELSRAGLAARTAARRLSCLRQFYRFLMLESVREDDPTERQQAPE